VEIELSRCQQERGIKFLPGPCPKERREIHTKFLSENLKGRYHFGDLGVDGRIILKTCLKFVRYESVDWMHITWYRVLRVQC
jgi:hypothetical protein